MLGCAPYHVSITWSKFLPLKKKPAGHKKPCLLWIIVIGDQILFWIVLKNMFSPDNKDSSPCGATTVEWPCHQGAMCHSGGTLRDRIGWTDHPPAYLVPVPYPSHHRPSTREAGAGERSSSRLLENMTPIKLWRPGSRSAASAQLSHTGRQEANAGRWTHPPGSLRKLQMKLVVVKNIGRLDWNWQGMMICCFLFWDTQRKKIIELSAL